MSKPVVKICKSCKEIFLDSTINHSRWYCPIHNTKREKHIRCRKKVKDLIFKILGGKKCRKCGFTDERALQIDHVNGGGKKERDKFGGSWESNYRLIINNPKNYQILCANCNWIKRVEKGEVSRGRKKDETDNKS